MRWAPDARRLLHLPLLLLCTLAATGCSRLADALFLQPEQGTHQTPGTLGLDYEDLRFPTPDGVELHGWWVPGKPRQPTVLILHDGTGNISGRVDLLRQFHDWLGVNLLIFDYRGFGDSEGRPDDQGLLVDTMTARRLLAARGWDREGVVLYGNGIGAALAATSALAAPPSGVVLEAAFPNTQQMLRARHPFLSSLLGPWLKGRFDTLGAVATMGTPALFLHGDQDRRVPIGLGWQVYDACGSPKWFRTVSGANHRDTAFVGGETYWGAWRDFLGRIQSTADGAGAVR